MAEQRRACVIGAGISGLTAGKALGDAGGPYTCFEASDDLGGNWYFGNPNGRSSAYRSLHIDTYRDSVSFRDMPMGEDYPDYPHHEQIFRYFQARTPSDCVTESASDAGRARRTEAGTRLEDHARGWRCSRVRLPRRRQRPSLGPALPGLPGKLRRRDPPLPSLHLTDRAQRLTGKRVLGGSATARWTSSRSSHARASPRRCSSRRAAAHG